MLKKINYFLLTKSLGLYLNCLVYLFPKKAQTKAYDLFSTPRKGKINQLKVPKFLQAHRSEQLNYQNHTFQTYTWSGNSEIILLLHGWESNSSRWKKTFPHLLQLGKTIIAIDAPAHGLSSGKEFNVPLYVEFVHVLVQKYQPKTIIGHSVGGMAAMYYQYKYPNSNLQKMILLGAPSDLKVILNNYCLLLSLNPLNKKLFFDCFKIKFNIDVNNFSSAIFAKNTTLKTFVAHDTSDLVVAFEESKKIHASFEKSVYVVTKNLGHSLHDKVLYTQIIDFIEN